MTTQEAIEYGENILVVAGEDDIDLIGFTTLAIIALRKQNKYHKKAKRFKRKWLRLRSNINNAREQINYNANYCYFDYTNIDKLLGYQDGLYYALSVIRECLGED